MMVAKKVERLAETTVDSMVVRMVRQMVAKSDMKTVTPMVVQMAAK